VIVLDASVVLEILLWSEEGRRISARVLDRGESRHAPHLLDVEVAQVIRRYWLARQIDEQRARQAMEDLGVFPVERHAHTILLPRIWELRNTLSAYDAAYLALSEALQATLLTRDSGLAAAARAFSPVELL
jgi:predicted nucleic acid-binding protein